MLKKLYELRARSVNSAILKDLPPRVRMLRGDEAAALLAVTNALMLSISKTFGKLVVEAPHRLPRAAALDIANSLIGQRARIAASLSAAGKRPNRDVAYRTSVRQMMAIEIVFLTIMTGISPRSGRDVTAIWRHIYKARRFAPDGARMLLAFHKVYRTSPFPDGISLRPSDVARLARSLPPIFRTRRA